MQELKGAEMKILKYFLGLLLMVWLAFLTFGYILPTAEYQAEVRVGRPVADVFSFVKEPRHWPEWLGGVVKVQPLPERGVQAGDQFTVEVEDRGNRMTLRETIVEVQPNRRFVYRLEAPRIQGEVEMSFYPEGDATRILMKGSFRGKGLVWRSVVPFMKNPLEKQANKDLQKLKEILEK